MIDTNLPYRVVDHCTISQYILLDRGDHCIWDWIYTWTCRYRNEACIYSDVPLIRPTRWRQNYCS